MSKTKYNYNYMADIREDGTEILHYDNPDFPVSIEEAGIDDIIRIAYQDNSRD